MPPKVKTTKEDILDAAVCIVREQGFEQLNARSLAKKLGTSVQPIFRCFDNMEDLKTTVVQRIGQMYMEYLMKNVSKEDALMGVLMAYIRFAQEEKNFFKLLQSSDRYGFDSMSQLSEQGGNREIVKVMMEMTGLDWEKASRLYSSCLVAAHGLAVLLSTNHMRFPEEEIRRMMEDIFWGVAQRLQKE